MAMAQLHSGEAQSEQTRVETRDHTKKIIKGNNSSNPRIRAVFIPLLLSETSSTEQMQQTHVQHNILLCPAFHLTPHACNGGGVCVTSGMTANIRHHAAESRRLTNVAALASHRK
ncbi:hypothetical protein TcCL_Unassigned05207 [Trypanosoma cruzi]|nr:hypothetical protein TcCL_Unassigned05207 [Trypanosoma cruzi]